MNKRRFLQGAAAALIGLGLALPAQAQLTAGKEYTGLSPAQPTDSPGKIEVVEFFSFNCIHCFRLHPFTKEFEKSLPKDVVFKRVPVTWGDARMTPTAKLFYALEATGDLAKLEDAVFSAVHEQKIVLMSDDAVKSWMAKQPGVDTAKFNATYDSFGVKSKVSRADQLVSAYQVKGTPAVYVDGRYAVRNASYDSVMKIAGQLVDKARGERGKK